MPKYLCEGNEWMFQRGGGGDTALKPGYWKDEEKEIAQLGFTSFKVKDDV